MKTVTKKMRQSSRRRNTKGAYRSRMNNGQIGRDHVKQLNSYRKFLASVMDKLGFSGLIKGNR